VLSDATRRTLEDTYGAMSGDNVELVRTIYAMLKKAYADREYGREDFAAFYHPDVVLRTSGILPQDTEHHGYDGVREFAAEYAHEFRSLFVVPHEYIDADERVVVPLRFGGEARETGIETTLYVVHVWTIRDGKVSELVIYRSRDEAVEAAGGTQ
jgi:ketosteroid isomerase-like protein